MARGKNIQLYLMDGDVNGRIKCTLANWTGLAFKIPRTALDLCKDRPELKQTGVYLLFGKDENDKSVVYIGQAGVRKNGEGILNRLVEHNRKCISKIPCILRKNVVSCIKSKCSKILNKKYCRSSCISFSEYMYLP